MKVAQFPDASADVPRQSSRTLPVLLVFILIVHLGVAWASSRHGVVQDDAESYVRLGQNLAAGHGYVFEPGRAPTSWRAPGYPVFLAGIFFLTGGSLVAARIGSAFIWTLTALLAYALGRRLVGHPAAIVAAAIVGLSPELAGLTGLLWSESLFVCLFLASLLAIVRWRTESPSWLLAVGIGVLFGVTVLTRSTAMILFPVLWFATLTSSAPRKRVVQTVLVMAVGLAVVGSWTIRNFTLHGHFILVESNMGFNLYVGNSPDTPIPFAWKKTNMLEYDKRYKQIIDGRSEGDRNAGLSRTAIAQMKSHPLRTIALAVGKGFDFWLPDFFIASNLRAGSFGPEYQRLWKPVLAITVAVFLILVGATARGVFRNARSWSTWFVAIVIALYTAPHMVVYGASRYHTPLMPLIIILAAPELQRAWVWFRRRGPA